MTKSVGGLGKKFKTIVSDTDIRSMLEKLRERVNLNIPSTRSPAFAGNSISGPNEVHPPVNRIDQGEASKGTGKVYPTRQIDSVAEAHIIDRVKELRGNLTSGYKKSGNFALA
ncbi:hypothetical protein [Paenibacillus sp. UMB4589-SE434]|uniref:hypothetical protein n=1 Tax=Paenibacillus sp. UMB4589-SE434 TaxID=3046314 RepID=UPI00254FA6C2|nr:hypothetical protein [Paenibacillus sp. UMB4589-SE434]MDK8180631.1 hypothetical protein [Paenibacillus sp. UMB4589-SE434]